MAVVVVRSDESKLEEAPELNAESNASEFELDLELDGPEMFGYAHD